MKKSLLLITWMYLLLPLNSLAQPLTSRTVLNKLSYSLTVEKWAKTSTARVIVNIDASLDKIGLANINTHIMSNLQKLANSNDWHITQFSRNQDKSGLEMVHVEAEARLAANTITSLREKAKSASSPGETYTVVDIDFRPGIADIQQAHAEARSDIYENVKQEISRLNQVYPNQHYFLHSIDFNAPPMQMQTTQAVEAFVPAVASANLAGGFTGSGVATISPRSSITVINQKIQETAQVVIASQTSVSRSEVQTNSEDK